MNLTIAHIANEIRAYMADENEAVARGTQQEMFDRRVSQLDSENKLLCDLMRHIISSIQDENIGAMETELAARYVLMFASIYHNACAKASADSDSSVKVSDN